LDHICFPFPRTHLTLSKPLNLPVFKEILHVSQIKEWNPMSKRQKTPPVYIPEKMNLEENAPMFSDLLYLQSRIWSGHPKSSPSRYILHTRAFAAWVARSPAAPTERSASTTEIQFDRFRTTAFVVFSKLAGEFGCSGGVCTCGCFSGSIA
jgi:hypothetical protein